jgi:hypothetical protein
MKREMGPSTLGVFLVAFALHIYRKEDEIILRQTEDNYEEKIEVWGRDRGKGLSNANIHACIYACAVWNENDIPSLPPLIVS